MFGEEIDLRDESYRDNTADEPYKSANMLLIVSLLNDLGADLIQIAEGKFITSNNRFDFTFINDLFVVRKSKVIKLPLRHFRDIEIFSMRLSENEEYEDIYPLISALVKRYL